jgi:eukaryotic-like serine/threonine-protein kinase
VIGRVVGKYKISEQIGEGGMGIVYRGEHTMLGSPAAIKVLLPQFTRDTEVVDRFFTEAKATSAIRHPGIVQVFDFGRLDSDRAYLVMELLRGEDLTGFLGRRRVLDAPLAAQIMLQLLSALEAAHVHGVIHRDIKPDNIYLVRDTSAPGAIRVKILDFGIAKLMPQQQGESRPRTTKENTILGTPAYMAPEQCRSGVDIDARADLYAAGCILFEMVTGRPPFVADNAAETMAMHVYEAPPRVRDFVPAMPLELDNLIAKMLAKSPADRTPSAAWALAALERISLQALTGEVPLMGPGAPVAPGPTDSSERLPRWIPLVVILVAVLVAAAAVVVIGFI